MDFAKTAKKNPKLNELYQEINAWKVIVPEKSLDNDSAWGSYINDNNNAVISYAKTENKECALAHELLHFSIQKSGYIRMKSSATTLQSVLMKRLVDCLDNELQHHRMYAQYRSLGYTPKSFYNDADCLVAQYLTDVLDGNKMEPLELIPDYMTLIAPGGSLTMKEKQKFSAMFRTSTSAPEVFDTIDGAIKKWTEAASLDQKSVVSSIISSIPGEHSTWIGFDNGTGFPDSGFFVGKPLTKEEFASHMG
ncbi:hypothetical protein ACTG2T_20805 [Aeromonas sp. 75A]|uniref:hypothetical protein n=1 Tax=unclassified Aeromonas TaxID=257493 RepID=UPI002E7ABA79|nr:hypothetical protein [Aeromonas sp. 43P]MEE1952321.1 hypothetical protein [Aeromonas sp. 43P]